MTRLKPGAVLVSRTPGKGSGLGEGVDRPRRTGPLVQSTSPVSSLCVYLCSTFQPSPSTRRGTLLLSSPVGWQRQWSEREKHPSTVTLQPGDLLGGLFS